MKRIESEGARVTYLPVDGLGMLDSEQVARTIRPETIMVSVMAATRDWGHTAA